MAICGIGEPLVLSRAVFIHLPNQLISFWYQPFFFATLKMLFPSRSARLPIGLVRSPSHTKGLVAVSSSVLLIRSPPRPVPLRIMSVRSSLSVGERAPGLRSVCCQNFRLPAFRGFWRSWPAATCGASYTEMGENVLIGGIGSGDTVPRERRA